MPPNCSLTHGQLRVRFYLKTGRGVRGPGFKDKPHHFVLCFASSFLSSGWRNRPFVEKRARWARPGPWGAELHKTTIHGAQ